MEPEGSLPHSQVPATCPYPETAKSSPCPPHPTSWRSVLILFSHLCLGLPNGLLPSGFPAKTTIYTSPVAHMCYMPLPSHSSRFEHPNNIGWAVHLFICRSQWPCGLRRRSSAARLLRLWVRIPSGTRMFVVSVVCCQVEVLRRIDHSSRGVLLWHVVCYKETSNTRRLKPATGLWKIQPHWVVTPGKETNICLYKDNDYFSDRCMFQN